MNLGAVSLVYNEAPLIEGCVESLKPFVNRHVMLVSERPYYGQCLLSDGSADIADELGCEVVEGFWEMDHHQRNTGIAMLQDCDWIICTDVDMWLEHHVVEKLINKLENTTSEAFIIKQQSYWKTTEWRIKDDDFKPVIAIKPHVRFVHIGNVAAPCEVLEDIEIHHLAWCAPKDIKKKIETYSHAKDHNWDGWYEKHYENWKEGEDIVFPDRTFKAEYNPLPEELKQYL